MRSARSERRRRALPSRWVRLRRCEAARLRHSVVGLETALATGGEAPVAVAAARTQTAALAGSFAAAVAEARRGNAAAAQQWLLVRGFEGVTSTATLMLERRSR